MRSHLLVALALAPVATVTGQESAILLAPTAGLRMHTVYESQGSIVFVGFPDLPDTSRGDYEAVVGMTRRFVEPADGSWIVETTYDSSRVRYRTGAGEAWQVLPTPVAAVGPLRSVIDARLAETPTDQPADDWTVRELRALRGMVELVLPARALGAGDRWADTLAMPYLVELPGDPPTVLNVRLNGRVTSIVDSVVPRRADTLVYVSLQGGLNPLRVDTAYVEQDLELPVTIWGSVGATFVWSSGWDAWVSGRSTLRMHHRAETGALAERDITASAEITTRFWIRP